MTPDVEKLAEAVREGLVDGNEWSCGCDDPGNPSRCIHVERFEALDELVTLAERERVASTRADQAEQTKEIFSDAYGREMTRADALETALREIEQADLKTNVLTLNRIAREALAAVASAGDTKTQ